MESQQQHQQPDAVEVPDKAPPETHEQLVIRLRYELQQLQDRLPSVNRTFDYAVFCEKALALCQAATGACRRRAVQQEEARVKAAMAEASAAGMDPAAAAAGAAAAGGALLTYPAVLALLPQPDDGLTCMLLRLNASWAGPARVQAFVGRFGAQPVSTSKAAGQDFAVLTFSSAAERDAFATGFRAEVNAGARADAVLRLPGETDPLPQPLAPPARGGRKRGPDDAAQQQQKQQKQQPQQQPQQRQAKRGGRQQRAGGPPDIRSVVCPLWDVPYAQQLSSKAETVTTNLQRMAELVAKTYHVGADPSRKHAPPQWVQDALRGPGKLAVPLRGIYRSPQLNGYRNKAEFSIGLDADEQPIVGFLQGLYVDGLTQVADPSACRHMSPTSLAYAAATTAFLRSEHNTLPVWDKRHGKGFWRLLVVREGRHSSFLPLPAPPAAADGDGADAAAGAGAAAAAAGGGSDAVGQVYHPGTMADLPADKWLVRLGSDEDADAAAAAAAGNGQGLALSQVGEAAEPPAPPPAEVLLLVQVNPLAAPGGPPQIRQQLAALRTALVAAAAAAQQQDQQGHPLAPPTSFAVQYHSGVANAAPPSAPLTPFPAAADDEGAPAAAAAAAAPNGQAGDADMADADVAAAAAAAGGGGGGAAGAAAAGAGAAAESRALGITDHLCELAFRVSPLAFYQINAGATCVLYHVLGRLAQVGPHSLLLDVCCGTGTIGLTLAEQVAAVVGVDNVCGAIEDARANAALNGITNATFVCGAAEAVMKGLLEEHAPKHEHVVAIVDPPRAGLHKDVLLALLGCERLKRLVFVSCNTEALALNASILCGRYRANLNAPSSHPKRGGAGKPRQQAPPPLPPYAPFRPTAALAFDLFPHTHHVEAAVVFERE